MHADELIEAHPPGIAILHQLAQQVSDLPLSDVLGQPFRKEPDYVDAYAAHLVHGLICSGDLYVAQVEIGAMPLADRCLEENRALLHAGLKAPFKFGLTCANGADEDGWLRWGAPLKFVRHFCDETKPACGPSCGIEHVTVPPATVPMEVGSTEYVTTAGHVSMFGGLARWPYKSTKITILFARPGWLDTFQIQGG